MPKKLRTEADGRALAFKMLREAEDTHVDEACAYPRAYDDDDVRNGRPQANFFLRYLKRLRKADSEEVYRGFASILSDFCSSAYEGASSAELYERLENDARMALH
jgi:hypothetical protein